jgi:CSLREA domain-containing protein
MGVPIVKPIVKKNIALRQLTLLGVALTLLPGFVNAEIFEPGNTYIVNTSADSTDGACTASLCSLRDAVNQANADTGGDDSPVSDTINFNIPASDPGCSGGICTLSLLSVLPATFSELALTIDATSSTQSIVISGSKQGLSENPTPGMIQNNGPLTLTALTIENFSCNSNEQGCTFSGISGYYAPLSVFNSTFISNSSVNSLGGAILMQNAALTIQNSTFYQNSAAVWGGAINCDGCTMTVTNSTFVGNTAGTSGGGGAIYITGDGAGTLTNTILAAGGSHGNCGIGGIEDDSTLTDGGGNLSDDASCDFSLASSSNNVPDTNATPPPIPLNLGSLAYNGGPTETIAVLGGSVASSDGVVANCPTTDQRGAARPTSGPLEGTCTSGAYQVGANSTGTVAGCTAPAVCNLTGGDSQTVAAGTAAAAAALARLTGSNALITENVCLIAQDPRAICGAISSTPHYTKNTTFPVSEFCPGFGNTVVPDYLCGAYSSNGPEVPPVAPNNGLAVLQGIGNGVNGIPGLLWISDANPDVYFHFIPTGGYASECNGDGLPISPITGNPDGISVGWAPWSGSAVEGAIPETPRVEEVTDGCGGQKNASGGVSVTLIGVTLNLSNAVQELGPAAAHNSAPVNLAEFAGYKYANLFTEVAVDNVPLSNKVKLLAILTQSALFLATGSHACAETTLYDADKYVTANGTVFGGNSIDPNSYGRTRTRILNLFYTLYTRLDGKPNPITSLSIDVPFPLLNPAFTPPVCSKPHL